MLGKIKVKFNTSNIMYLNAGTKMHEKIAFLNIVHYKPSHKYGSKLRVIFL